MKASLKERILQAQQGESEAERCLLEENAGLIHGIVRRYLGRGVEAEDLYQLGCIGFLKAVRGFDFTYGTEFSTYSVPKIDGEIRRYFRDNGAIKVSRTIKSNAYLLYRCKAELEAESGRDATLSELEKATGLSREEILEAEGAAREVSSMQQETGDGMTLEGIIADKETEEDVLEKIALRQGISSLPQREGMVVSLRYYRGFTQAQVARVLQVSQVQVSRLEKRAMERLREYFR
ncbi:MAG: sigma-70 family RNA polymerase sigma factor [Oscillospiraceae bacterium]|nr:sigma-70 family RNA polymerase sigma factor [Oscillospiraceae bacterium]